MATPWPLFELEIRTPRLVLRPPTDDDLGELADLAAAGIHDPTTMPFSTPWTDQPVADLRLGVLRWTWRNRADLTADDWKLGLAVFEAGRCVGVQDLQATRFAVRRTVATGSWLGLAHQGRGIGREMRAAVLHLAFAELGAQRAETAGFVDNPRSLAVTRALGYRPNGDEVLERRGEAARCLRFVLDRDRWASTRRHDIEVVGLDGCRRLLGAPDDAPRPATG